MRLAVAMMIGLSINLFFSRGAPVKAADISLYMAILPLQCSIELVHDGIQEVVRITPEACQRVINQKQLRTQEITSTNCECMLLE